MRFLSFGPSIRAGYGKGHMQTPHNQLYANLAAQLGDLDFQISLLKQRKKDVLQKIHHLNTAAELIKPVQDDSKLNEAKSKST